MINPSWPCEFFATLSHREPGHPKTLHGSVALSGWEEHADAFVLVDPSNGLSEERRHGDDLNFRRKHDRLGFDRVGYQKVSNRTLLEPFHRSSAEYSMRDRGVDGNRT